MPGGVAQALQAVQVTADRNKQDIANLEGALQTNNADLANLEEALDADTRHLVGVVRTNRDIVADIVAEGMQAQDLKCDVSRGVVQNLCGGSICDNIP